MTERFVSPGVFTSERDISFLPQGIAEIGAAIIGPTSKGPAFRPTVVESQDDFLRVFGAVTADSYTGYTAQLYLKHANRATVVRVLGLDGYSPTTYKSYYLTITGSRGEYVAGVVHHTVRNQSSASVSISAMSGSSSFGLLLTGSTRMDAFTCSMGTTDTNYLPNVIGDGVNGIYDGYVYSIFPRAVNLAGTDAYVKSYAANAVMSLTGSVYGEYSNAHTPWIQSQTIGGTKFNLFKLHTLTDGNAANTDVKVSIVGIKANALSTEYGVFSLAVRSYDDTDSSQNVLEQYDNLTLDPDSPDYIARRIGNSVPMVDESGNAFLDGEYKNNSKYIYVEMNSGVETLPVTILPFGFAQLNPPIALSSVPSASYITTRYAVPSGGTSSVANNKIYYGFDFTDITNLSYLAPLPSGSEAITIGNAFSLENLATTDGPETTGSLIINTTYRKFTVPFQGGFDGKDPAANKAVGTNITAQNLFGFNLSDSTSEGSRAYSLALDTVKNPTGLDINMLLVPGVLFAKHSFVANKGITICEDRADAFYIMDADALDATVNSVVSTVSTIDSNYVAVYHPWVKTLDTNTNKQIWVPPSVVMGGVFAYNDLVGAEWFAPAGLNRGGIPAALNVKTRLSKAHMDTLYEGRVNPIVLFPETGITTWGQKTLQVRSSALDRINVRRLLIVAKKAIASFANYLVFEPNTDATRQRFLNMANPYLQSIQERQGLYAFEVKMDAENNTPDLIDRNILVGQIWLQPVKASEFISLEFNITNTGASFSE